MQHCFAVVRFAATAFRVWDGRWFGATVSPPVVAMALLDVTQLRRARRSLESVAAPRERRASRATRRRQEKRSPHYPKHAEFRPCTNRNYVKVLSLRPEC